MRFPYVFDSVGRARRKTALLALPLLAIALAGGRTRFATLQAPSSTPATGVEWRVVVPEADVDRRAPAVPGACVEVEVVLVERVALCEVGTLRCGPPPVAGAGECSSIGRL